MNWTEEQVAKLRELAALGKSASTIAEEMGGVSRNAVIGACHRNEIVLFGGLGKSANDDEDAGEVFWPISTDGLPHPIRTGSGGKPPRLDYLAIADLVVDQSYQREIGRQGLRNVSRIAANFSWLNFTPVIVAPLANGKYAIIDGQHRTMAALFCGFERVPAAIIEATRAEQAAAFKAVNAAVTRVSNITTFHAALAAEDPIAVGVAKACGAAGVRIRRYPVAAAEMNPGDTIAIGALKKAFVAFGHDTLVTALQCITETENNEPGAVRATIIVGVAQTLHRHPGWQNAGGALFDAVDQIDLVQIFEANHQHVHFAREFAKQLAPLMAKAAA